MIVAAEIYQAILALEFRYARLLDDDRLEEWPGTVRRTWGLQGHSSGELASRAETGDFVL